MTKNPLIVALDVEDRAAALRLMERCGPAVDFYKVGLELFTAEGPQVVRDLVSAGKQVFFDLKMFDIGATIERAAARAAALGASLLTVHCSPQVIRAATAASAGSQLKILAVTVLTSFDRQDLEDMGVTGRTPAQQVSFLAERGLRAGCHGLVCSALEAAALRELAGPSALLVTPGVRSPGAFSHDQKRVATPREAIAAGADYIVVGREITRAPDPAVAAGRILASIGGASALAGPPAP